MLQFFQKNILHKSTIIGFCLAVGIFSPYIFKDDNLAEELAELFIYKETGVFVDFTPDSKEKVTTNWESITELSDKYGIYH